MTPGKAQPATLAGSWTKVQGSSCADKYPDTIRFAEGTYRGTRGASQGMIWWDAGIYRLEGPRTLIVGTATDELVKYDIEIAGDRMDIVDPEGCRFSYRRQTS